MLTRTTRIATMLMSLVLGVAITAPAEAALAACNTQHIKIPRGPPNGDRERDNKNNKYIYIYIPLYIKIHRKTCRDGRHPRYGV